MAAALARGRTVLENAAREPEVEDLARLLNAMGARVAGAGTDVVTIDGVDALQPAEHVVIPDRIEAGTLLVAAAVTGGEVLVEDARAEHLEAVIAKLREAGCRVESTPEGVHLRGPATPRSTDVKTSEHPGFPTDMQAQLMVLMSVADGTSI